MGKAGKAKTTEKVCEPPREMVRVTQWLTREQVSAKYGEGRVELMTQGCDKEAVDGIDMWNVVVAVLPAHGPVIYQ